MSTAQTGARASPEGHTVHRLANAFNAEFAGHMLKASSPQGRFAEGAATLDGLELDHAEAWGKQMFLQFDGPVWLRVHLGLYGMWRFAGPGLSGIGRRSRVPVEATEDIPAPKGAVRLRLVSERHVADLSGPTACELLDDAGKLAATDKLGPDPLRDDADPDKAWKIVHGSRMAIGQLLMRQDVVAGIGNIYRAELLFRAGINPHRPGNALTKREWTALWKDMTALLRDGLKTGRIITTKPPYRKRGFNYVAHRAGEPCRVCATVVEAEMMAGRRLYWCPRCQAG